MKKKSELIIKRGANHPGMTLIEVLVALAISGIIAITFLPIFSTGIKYLVNKGKLIESTTKETGLIKGFTIPATGKGYGNKSYPSSHFVLSVLRIRGLPQQGWWIT
jgi:prepilin-type N-terminal cleavage/methylation domain-containing protein